MKLAELICPCPAEMRVGAVLAAAEGAEPDPPQPFALDMHLSGSLFIAESKPGLGQRLCDERHDPRYVVLFRHAVCN